MLSGGPFPIVDLAVASTAILIVASCAGPPRTSDPQPTSADDATTVAALDEEYQQAVKRNDARTMARILAEDFVLVTGRGATYDKRDLLGEARRATTIYERQDVQMRTVRVWGDTAVVTALLWIKGTRGGQPIDYKLWYSDTYVRTGDGWRYVLGQASLPLPPAQPAPPR